MRLIPIVLIAITAFIIGNVWSAPYKFVIRSIYENKYGGLVYNCDSAMRNHFIASKSLELESTEENINQLDAAEIGLFDCHEYDKNRKLLLSLGLNEYDLSLISLKFIEKNASDITEIVKTHEISY